MITHSMPESQTFDCTVESDNAPMEYLLAESDKLVKALESRYPPEIPEPKK